MRKKQQTIFGVTDEYRSQIERASIRAMSRYSF